MVAHNALVVRNGAFLLVCALLLSSGAVAKSKHVPGAAKAPPSTSTSTSASPSPSPSRSASHSAPTSTGPALRVLSLDPTKPKQVYKLNAAPGLATVIQLPEPWAVMPTCGDCVYGDADLKGQLYRIDVFEETRTLSIKPTRSPGPDIPASAFVTNLDVALLGGISVTFFVELTLPEQADARVELQIPESETGKSRVSVKERELEERFEERVADSANERMLDALQTKVTCRDFWGGPQRSSGLVVRLRQLCKSGAFLWVSFEVENRWRQDVSLETATLTGTNGLSSSLLRFAKEDLRFNERANGVAAVVLEGAEVKPGTYTLTVVEDEGMNRQVVIEGIEF